MTVQVIAFNRDNARALARALRTIEDHGSRLTCIAAAAELAGNSDALGILSDAAITTHALDPDAVQAALTSGVIRALDLRAGRPSTRRPTPRKEPPRPLMREMPLATPSRPSNQPSWRRASPRC